MTKPKVVSLQKSTHLIVFSINGTKQPDVLMGKKKLESYLTPCIIINSRQIRASNDTLRM
jgi:hypothetical protein